MINVGTLDRVARFIVGAALVIAPLLTGWPIWAVPLAFWASLVAGAALLATSVVGFCPIYAVLRLSSKRA